MLDIELLKNILIVGFSSSILITILVQKIKAHLKTKKYIVLISFIVSIIIGTLFSQNFSDINLKYSLRAVLFSFIGVDVLYLAFEDKIFKSFSDIEKVTILERNR